MIKLIKSFNHKGTILEAGAVIGLGEMEDTLIKSGAAERYNPQQEKEEDDRPTLEDYKKLLEELEKKEKIIEELQQKEKAEEKDDGETPEPPKDIEPEKEKEPDKKPEVGRTKK